MVLCSMVQFLRGLFEPFRERSGLVPPEYLCEWAACDLGLRRGCELRRSPGRRNSRDYLSGLTPNRSNLMRRFHFSISTIGVA